MCWQTSNVAINREWVLFYYWHLISLKCKSHSIVQIVLYWRTKTKLKNVSINFLNVFYWASSQKAILAHEIRYIITFFYTLFACWLNPEHFQYFFGNFSSRVSFFVFCFKLWRDFLFPYRKTSNQKFVYLFPFLSSFESIFIEFPKLQIILFEWFKYERFNQMPGEIFSVISWWNRH